jgi:sec-independent protein translocase protein TatC
VFTMFIVAIPASLAYGLGLGLLWVYTRVGSRAPQRHRETAD